MFGDASARLVQSRTPSGGSGYFLEVQFEAGEQRLGEFPVEGRLRISQARNLHLRCRVVLAKMGRTLFGPCQRKLQNLTFRLSQIFPLCNSGLG